MTIRLATRADWPLVRQILADAGVPVKVDDAREAAPRELADRVWLDDEVGAICRIAIMADIRQLQVAWLLPAGMGRGRLGRVLMAALRDVLARRPDVATWTIAATFPNGVDENGQPDGGRGACLAWQQIFPGARVRQIGRAGTWEISWTLVEAAAVEVLR